MHNYTPLAAELMMHGLLTPPEYVRPRAFSILAYVVSGGAFKAVRRASIKQSAGKPNRFERRKGRHGTR